MSLSAHRKAILALIIANFLWGAGAPIFKWALENIHPFTLAYLRFAIAALLLFPFVYKRLAIEKRDILPVFLFSFFGIFINITFFFLGLLRTSSINLPIIASSGPIFIIIGSLLFLHEKTKSKVIIGTVLSLAGVLVIILRPLLDRGLDGSVVGNLFFVVSTLGIVGHTIILRKIAPRYSALTLTFWSFIIGAFAFLPLFLTEAGQYGFLPGLTQQGVIGILYGVICSSALAYSFYDLALKYVVASEAGIFVYVDPIATIVIAMPLLGEVITIPYAIGAILVFSGIFIAEGRIHYHPFHRLRNNHFL